ncbi:hypothetical protein A3G67_02220 [Candidatus Roizmanbacteria bacterium RIFCSPLOWO2_12_FULL_40_12]|uniref:Uncharacterized protein n=1 Tax=Candidatus Roizmanbacteria bacterium RIFCSPLOWO2_01_FULL_40_42 TaxID=1802066 RepID=A0A1F7J3Q1_9BACT|nr:MAG: hypothetical protein A2779_01425 [Candidatus Roizmanbacteria bacterium RIFCSPHIGHO2_01_FULL_40_98]OGK29020.1 MAG: hypothetical protein A3C31_02065 [Candidatus Roizmanbacteria bacterium RIFCSPHIGHO2_02_FULL_40_53]OGK29983.1 MAG: hypothetical protein A2W49_00145 [Candidatus Roizmanbacteria bacterium RIFCSPHIGHO2_12_41_18]OGK37308.1 MAG: hypothetical protein A3E69_04365 [Candidatus Roizmanbacteria bacterium RIFCSPHIGHO2_12_FULL_40_130]OGK50250.1 MAG: hypothetical protein A3B50_00520 [Candi
MEAGESVSNQKGEGDCRRNTLEDLRRVGPDKPLGYLPLSFIHRESGLKAIIREMRQKGLKTELFPTVEQVKPMNGRGLALPVLSANLYVYDEKALGEFLLKHKDILRHYKWPTKPDKFLKKVARKTAQSKTELFDLIADAFADYDNPGRLKPGISPDFSNK